MNPSPGTTDDLVIAGELDRGEPLWSTDSWRSFDAVMETSAGTLVVVTVAIE